MLNDGLKLTGKLTIALNDEIVQEVPNLVVTAGKEYVASRIKDASATAMSHMAIGTGSTAAASDDSNLSTARAWNFARTLNNLDTPARGNSRSLSHIQSQAAASNAFTKLEQTIAGVVAEIAQYEAYIQRLEHASNNASEVAVEKEKGHSRIEDTNYAYETTELTRTQIITQAATAILAQANQSQQMFLELLR
mgnify:CR=1 FL=1